MGKRGQVRVKQIGRPQVPMNPMANLIPQGMEDIKLPAPVQTDAIFPWPATEVHTMPDPKNGQQGDYVIIYPNYLDRNKTAKLGRRIKLEEAVERPSSQEMSHACVKLGMRHWIEPYKSYSRDPDTRWDEGRGRLRVELINPSTGAPRVREILTKKDLCKSIAAIIPDLSVRHERIKKEIEEKIKEEEKKAELMKKKTSDGGAGSETASSSGGAKGSGVKSNKKKGKKKR